jgi:DNA-binding transcriptional ArsR family regulator
MLLPMEINAFSALGNRTRRTIVNRLRMGPKSVEQIARSMKVSRPAVSQGLKVLLESGLVKRESRGRQAFYSLCGRGLERLRTFLEGLEDVIEKYGNKKPGA